MHDEDFPHAGGYRGRGPGPRRAWRGKEQGDWPGGPGEWSEGPGDWPGPRRGRRPGPPRGGFGPFGFGPRHGWGDPFGDPRMWHAGDPRMRHRRGPRVKRGDVRAAALSLIAEEPRNGYQIIQAISDRSDGMWQPSPGSVYPALQQLEDEGLIRAEENEGGRKAFRLTDEGQGYVAEHGEELRAPWEAVAGSVGDDVIGMRQLFGHVAMAAMQVVSVGTEEQIDAARRILTQARRNLYQILAADDDDAAAGEPGDGQEGPEGPGAREV
jgi:DNA-binding PadR family transcriptional regulator